MQKQKGGQATTRVFPATIWSDTLALAGIPGQVGPA